MSKKSRFIILLLIAAVLLFAGVLLFKIFRNESQTVGSVTVSQSKNKIEVRELAAPPGNKNPISPVIGKAYEITAKDALEKPARVKFAYDPAMLDARIPETELRLYKWHEVNGKGSWVKVPSRVDVKKNIVVAELKTFSILSVRAPLVYYFNEAEIARINGELSKLTKTKPSNTCGVSIIVDEELLVWDGNGDLAESYLREDLNDTEESRDCTGNPSDPVKVVDFSYPFERSKNNQRLQYYIHAALVWQTDSQKSAVMKGVITDQNGKPLSGITIGAEKTEYGPGTGSTVSNNKGEYELKLHSGRYLLTARGGKYCINQEWQEKLFAWGALPNPPRLREPWVKDFILRCADYYIDDTVTTPLSWQMMGMNFSGSAQHKMQGIQTNPADGGYGWEGLWTLDYYYRTDTKVTGGVAIGPSSATPLSGVIGDTSYDNAVQYNFSIPSKPAVGTVIAITGKALGNYTVGSSGAGGTYIIDGSWAVNSERKGGSYQGTTGNDFYDTLTVVEANGKEGAVLQLGGGTTGEKIKFNIKKRGQ